LACSEVGVDSGNFTTEMSESSADSLNNAETVAYFPFTINVGVENTQDVLEFGVVF
jgi:hypothetical protein